MKRFVLAIFTAAALLLAAGCNYLDIVPDNVATLDHAFTDRNSAEMYLATIYSYQPRQGQVNGDPALGCSDEYFFLHDGYGDEANYGYKMAFQNGLQNVSTPYYDFWKGGNGGRGTYIALRDCNTFFENIDKVNATLDEETKQYWIGEVTFLKAYYHFYLMRMFGPIPIIKENLPIAADVEQVRVYREPVDEVVDYIVELCDQAINLLPPAIVDPTMDYGRPTQVTAAMLKAEALVWLASPLFNGNNDYADVVDNRGKRLFPAEDQSRWTRAAEACKQAIDLAEANGVKLFKFMDQRYNLSETSRILMDCRGALTEKWNEENIWSRAGASISQSGSKPHFLSTELTGGGGSNGETCANFKIAEMFYSCNGVPIDEDPDYDYAGRYNLTTVGTDHYYYIPAGKKTAVLNTYREPRFYADLGFDTGYWWGCGRTLDVGMGTDSQTPWVLAAKMGEPGGPHSDIRYSKTGYFLKKIINYQTTQSSAGALTTVNYPWPLMRLADLYLLYAEALNESKDAPDDEVYEYIDKVRARAGLNGVVESWANHSTIPDKPRTKTGMREIIHRERLIELCFEGPRFYDLRRWKEAYAECNKVQLGWSVKQSTAEDYYVTVVIGQPVFSQRDYLWPIPESEILRNINMVQNPGWE